MLADAVRHQQHVHPFCISVSVVQGKSGHAMLLSAVRQDLERQHACTGREMLFKHGGMGQPPVSCYASLKSLTDGEHALQMTSMSVASVNTDKKGFRWRTCWLLARLQPKYWSCGSPRWRTFFGPANRGMIARSPCLTAGCSDCWQAKRSNGRLTETTLASQPPARCGPGTLVACTDSMSTQTKRVAPAGINGQGGTPSTRLYHKAACFGTLFSSRGRSGVSDCVLCSTVHTPFDLIRNAASQLDLCGAPPGHKLGARLRDHSLQLLMLHGERLGSDSETSGPFNEFSVAIIDGCCNAMAEGPSARNP